MDHELQTYIQSLVPQRDTLLTQMELRAAEQYIPILEIETAQFLRVWLRQMNPTNILEVGSAIGYSALVMAQSCNASIITIERDETRAAEALDHIKKAGMEDRIRLLQGDAFDILPTFLSEHREAFDVIFLDAAKGQYPNFLELVLPLLRKGGTLFSDNILFHGLVAGPEHVKHKLRTLVVRLREYNQLIADHPQLDTAFIPLGDGIAISVKV